MRSRSDTACAGGPSPATALPILPHFLREAALLASGLRLVAGIDEAGRGPLAGPVTAAAVILDPADLPSAVNDSKALAADAREDLFHLILAKAQAVGIGFASPREIDAVNIRQATFLAMRRAVAALAQRPCHALIDGNDCPPGIAAGAAEVLVKGDAICLSIAAASIVAKVARDRTMVRLDARHPQYGFARHKGYATPEHAAALRLHGPSPAHRMSFAPCRGEAAE